MRKKQLKLDCFGDKYSGHLVVQRMNNEELDKVRLDFGLLDGERKQKTPKENYDFMVQVFNRAKKYLIDSTVVRVEDSQPLSIEDLDYETELNTYRSEVAQAFLGGWAMGNGKEQQ